MRNRLIKPSLCVAAALSTIAIAGAQNAGTIPAEIRSFYEAGLKQNGIIGSNLLLLRANAPALRDSYGYARLEAAQPVDADTNFHWASITKTFNAIAIMQLRDRGKLKLDDPVVKYVPEIAAVHDPFGPVEAITIRQLLTHSAGFRSPTWPWGGDKPWHPFEPTKWSQIVAMLPYTEVEFAPGSKYSYSNLGYVFLGQIIERLSGDDFEVYIDKNILKPLEMYRTYFDKAPYTLLKYRSESFTISEGKLEKMPFDFDTGITVSNGGLNSPFTDMEMYLRFLLGDPAKSEIYDQVLSRASLEEMFKPQLKIGPAAADAQFGNGPDQHDSIGLCFFVREENGRRFIGHSGGQNGFISHFYIQPESRTAYLVNFNTDAVDKDKNTRRFDSELRDYLFGHFFATAAARH